MAGLLDFLNSDDAKMGIGLLAAAGPSTVPMNLGQRIQMAQQGQLADKQNALKLKLLQSQVDENGSQDMLRKAQIAKMTTDQAFMANIAQRLGGGAAPQGLPGTPGQSMGGAGGSGGAMGGGMAGGSPSGAAGGGGNAFPLSFGETVQAKLMGHDLMDAYKYANEPQQLQPGSLYRNRITGAMESLPSVSQNGQASQILPDPTAPGGYRVIAPNGATDVYKQYKDIDAGVKNQTTPMKVYNPTTKREEYVSESAVLGNAPTGNQVTPRSESDMRSNIANGDTGNSPRDLMREIATTKAQMNAADGKLGPSDKALLQGHIDNLTTQLKNYHGGAVSAGAGRGSQGTPGYAAGPSSDEAASAAGRQATANSIGGKAGELLKESSDAANSATQSVASAQRMVQALDSDKVLTGPGASLRLKGLQIASTLGMPGKDDAEKIANTRQAVQEMAKLTLEGRKQMSGQGAITNQESALAEKATSGSIDDLTAPEIRQLAQAAERTGRWKYAQHDAKMQAMSSDPAMAGNVALYKAAPMPEAKAATPVASMRFNPATGKLEKVQ